jgi:1-deoxy-D-xylulose-5-phosphate reductoisomerase
MTRRITILGATGSVGRSTVEVLRQQPEAFTVEAVVAGSDAKGLAALARAVGARFAALADPQAAGALRAELSGSGIASGAGESAVLEAVERDADVVLAAITGTAGLAPTYAALKPGRHIALANKESLVCAGEVFMADAKRIGAEVMPVDSEHNALQQALAAGSLADVVCATVTASGGPFRTWTRERIAASSPSQASAHPVWSMGSKINIDSATLMNKGLELIEAHHLFGLEPERLDVVVHPESIVHGLVEWQDGAVTAGLAAPDMKIPIANALRGDRRLPMGRPRLDLAAFGARPGRSPGRRGGSDDPERGKRGCGRRFPGRADRLLWHLRGGRGCLVQHGGTLPSGSLLRGGGPDYRRRGAQARAGYGAPGQGGGPVTRRKRARGSRWI